MKEAWDQPSRECMHACRVGGPETARCISARRGMNGLLHGVPAHGMAAQRHAPQRRIPTGACVVRAPIQAAAACMRRGACLLAADACVDTPSAAGHGSFQAAVRHGTRARHRTFFSASDDSFCLYSWRCISIAASALKRTRSHSTCSTPAGLAAASKRPDVTSSLSRRRYRRAATSSTMPCGTAACSHSTSAYARQGPVHCCDSAALPTCTRACDAW